MPVEVLFDEFKLYPNEASSKERGQQTTEIEVMMGSLTVRSMDTSLEEAKESINTSLKLYRKHNNLKLLEYEITYKIITTSHQ